MLTTRLLLTPRVRRSDLTAPARPFGDATEPHLQLVAEPNRESHQNTIEHLLTSAVGQLLQEAIEHLLQEAGVHLLLVVVSSLTKHLLFPLGCARLAGCSKPKPQEDSGPLPSRHSPPQCPGIQAAIAEGHPHKRSAVPWPKDLPSHTPPAESGNSGRR